MTIKHKSVDGTKLDLYRKLVTTLPRVDLKGDTIPYTSLNGHMFSYLHPFGAFALRLPDEERENLTRNTRPISSRPTEPSRRNR